MEIEILLPFHLFKMIFSGSLDYFVFDLTKKVLQEMGRNYPLSNLNTNNSDLIYDIAQLIVRAYLIHDPLIHTLIVKKLFKKEKSEKDWIYKSLEELGKECFTDNPLPFWGDRSIDSAFKKINLWGV